MPGGRPKGSPNKVTGAIKEAIEQAFDNVGGVAYLEKMATAEPKAFLALLGKVIPKVIKADINLHTHEEALSWLRDKPAENRETKH